MFTGKFQYTVPWPQPDDGYTSVSPSCRHDWFSEKFSILFTSHRAHAHVVDTGLEGCPPVARWCALHHHHAVDTHPCPSRARLAHRESPGSCSKALDPKIHPPPAKSSRNSPNYLGGGEGRRSSTMPYFGIMKLEDHVFFHLFSVQTFDRRKVASRPHPIINNDPILPSRTTGWWKEARERSSFTKCCSQKSIKFTYEFFLILFN